LLLVADPSRGAVDVYAASRDLAAGTVLSTDAIQLERITVGGGTALLFTRADASRLVAMRAAHALAAGQLIQRADVMSPTSFADGRLVFIPVSGLPSTSAGDRVDLLVIGGSAEHPTVAPFALGVDVQAATSGGLVVVVPAKQAAAFVYAAATMHLAAVVVEPGAADGSEIPISTADDALTVAAGRSAP
jgi:hypothetical protein